MSWFTNVHSQAVVIVEDQFSAIRAGDFLTSVALLGTNLNDERAAEIKASGYSPVYLALDADAWDLNVKYCIKYRSLLNLIPIRLKKDIKDHTNQQLTALLGELC